MYTELHEVAAHRVDEVSIKISLERIFAGRNVRVVLDSVLSIDFENRVLAGKAGAYPYDYLVLATGSKPAFFGVPGAEEISYTLWSYDDAVVLHEHLLRVFRCAAREADPAERRRLLTFYVVGAAGLSPINTCALPVTRMCLSRETILCMSQRANKIRFRRWLKTANRALNSLPTTWFRLRPGGGNCGNTIPSSTA